MSNHDGNGQGAEPNLLTELFLRLWTEQHQRARQLIIDSLKESQPGARQRCEGALHMLDGLAEQYASLPFGGLLRERLQSDCRTARHLLEQF